MIPFKSVKTVEINVKIYSLNNMRIMIAESCMHNWLPQIGKFMLSYDVGQRYVGLKAEIVNFE